MSLSWPLFSYQNINHSRSKNDILIKLTSGLASDDADHAFWSVCYAASDWPRTSLHPGVFV